MKDSTPVGDLFNNTMAGGLLVTGATTFFAPPASFGSSFALATSHTIFGFAGAVGIAGAVGYGAGLAVGACIFENDSDEQKNFAKICGIVAAGGVAASFLGAPLPIVVAGAAVVVIGSASALYLKN